MRLKKGDRVTTFYDYNAKDVVRVITSISKNTTYGSGYVASADGGEECEHCGKRPSTSIIDVDSSWFIKYSGPK